MTTTRFLVADEDAFVRRGVRTLVEERQGWLIVAESSNGLDAIRKATKFRPDVAVLALNLPRLDGLRTAQRILKHHPQTKLLFLTRYRSSALVRGTLQAGIKAYLLKSHAERELVRAVEAVLRNKPYYSSEIRQIVEGLGGEARKRKRGRKPAPSLTPRQTQIVRLLGDGKTSAEIAAALGITRKTADTHRADILRRTNCRSTADLVRYAIREGIINS